MIKGKDEMKAINLGIVIIVLVFGIGVGWAINNYTTTENKKEVKKLSECVSENHEEIRDVKQEVEVYKAEQVGEQKLIKKELENVNKKLDAIIKAINNNGGLLICDPIDTPKRGEHKTE